MWHVSSRSGVATLRTAIHLLLTYLLSYGPVSVSVRLRRHQRSRRLPVNLVYHPVIRAKPRELMTPPADQIREQNEQDPGRVASPMNRFQTGQGPCRANLHNGVLPNHLPVIVASD